MPPRRHTVDSFRNAIAPIPRLIGFVILTAVRKGATAITFERTAPDHLVVSYEIAGERHEEMRPPVKLWRPLMVAVTALAGTTLTSGATASFDLVNDLGSLSHTITARVAENDIGETVTLELRKPLTLVN